jgi:hypothetical protein
VDLSDLSPVLTAEGPFVTVLIGADSAVEQAADRYELAWKNVLKQLEDQGVAEPVREAVSGARGEHADGAARIVVASVPEARVVLSAPVSVPPPTDTVEVGPLPRLLPLVTDLTQRVPHVVVNADRTGADVSAFYDVDKTAHEVTVKGSTLHVHRVPGGGWSQLRYQHRAENQWARNGEEIAETARQLAEQVGAELVVGVGDAREVDLVRKALPTNWRGKYLEVPGGRGDDGSESLVQQRVRDAVARHVAAETLDLLAEFSQERGQVKRACDGVDDVVAALRKAQVQTLLVTTEADQSATLFYGAEPTALGTTREQLTALGVDDPQQGPLVEVLVRAAVGTAADVQLVPHEPSEAPNGGVGAVLRYSDDDNAAART